jgi:ATP-binding protein involved in chromosome partitioning
MIRGEGALPYVDPLVRYGLSVMSSGLLVGEDQVINPPPDAVGQLVLRTLRDVRWGELDFLLLDLPPSSGQPQQDLVQRLALSGVVIVTTPQDLSLLDAARSLQLFAENQVPILGVIENMSYFICPDCGERHEIFQRSERLRPAALQQARLLGRVPLEPAVSQGINRANPLMNADPDSPHAAAFLAAAQRLGEVLQQEDSHSG